MAIRLITQNFVVSVYFISLTIHGLSAETRIQNLLVDSKVRSRFASTEITSKILNVNEKPAEVFFDVQLPNAAFISNFSMLVNEKVIVGEVKEKEKAQQSYEKAKSRGQTTGLVAHVPRETNQFRIAVNVAANEKATFNLTYQEILKRVQGVYKHQININPGQVVEDLQVNVFIAEKRNITVLRIPKVAAKVGEKTNKNLLSTEEESSVAITTQPGEYINTATITWNPDSTAQKTFVKTGAQLVLLYDVERDQNEGEIETVNGYFVHHFAPENLPVGNKHVVFVLDRSGSMSGTKIQQLKEAMELILDDLAENDRLSIVTFATDVSVWKPKPITATKSNVRNAKKHVNLIDATGGTNIHDALQRGIEFMDLNADEDVLASMLIFLTDGEATSGKTSDEDILTGVNKWNKDSKYNIHSISFGNNADFGLLQKISAQNSGLARKLYEDSDAQLQLAGFYDEISSPLLSDVKVRYLNESIQPDTLFVDSSAVYSKGSEILAIGKVNPKKYSKDYKSVEVESVIEAKAADGPKAFKTTCVVPCWQICYARPRPYSCATPTPKTSIARRKRCVLRPPQPTCDFPCPPPPENPEPYSPLPADSIGGFVERMWAYLTIKKTLEESKYQAIGKDKKDELQKRALELSLRYGFVTELTSMVVVQPDSEKTELLEKGEEQLATEDSILGGGPPIPPGASAGASFGAGPPLRATANKIGPSQGRPVPRPKIFGTSTPPRPLLTVVFTTTRRGFTTTTHLPILAQKPKPTSNQSGTNTGTGQGKKKDKNPSAAKSGADKEVKEEPEPEESKKFIWKTAPESKFDINWDTVSKVANSRKQCALLCHADKKCKVALFTPTMKNCLLSYDSSTELKCSKAEESVKGKDPVVLFCAKYE